MAYRVIIPSRNLDNLAACIGALRAADEACRVIVVDDGIKYLWREFFAAAMPFVLCKGEQPFGFARNVNIGIRAAGDDDVVILNDDALLETPGGLARLAQDAAEHPEFGVIAASCDACGTPEQIHCDVRLNPAGEHYAVEPILHTAPLMVAFICVYIPRRVIDRVGLLDERFCVNAGGEGPRGYGCDDDDYCWRVRNAGLKLGVDNSVVVNHTRLKSTFRGDSEHPADVRLHEKVFEDKWGVSPRTGKPSCTQGQESTAELHKRWAADLKAWRKREHEVAE